MASRLFFDPLVAFGAVPFAAAVGMAFATSNHFPVSGQMVMSALSNQKHEIVDMDLTRRSMADRTSFPDNASLLSLVTAASCFINVRFHRYSPEDLSWGPGRWFFVGGLVGLAHFVWKWSDVAVARHLDLYLKEKGEVLDMEDTKLQTLWGFEFDIILCFLVDLPTCAVCGWALLKTYWGA